METPESWSPALRSPPFPGLAAATVHFRLCVPSAGIWASGPRTGKHEAPVRGGCGRLFAGAASPSQQGEWAGPAAPVRAAPSPPLTPPGTRLPSPPLPRAPSPWGVPSGARPQASLWAGRAEGWGSSKDFVFGVETLITAAQGDSRRTMSSSNALYLWSPTQMEVSAGRVTSPMPRQWLGPRSEWIKRLGKPPRLPVGLRR